LKWLTGNGIKPSSVTWYIDKANGSDLKRPAFEQMQKDIFNGAIKTVVIYKLDRLSRSMSDGVKVLADWGEKKVRLVCTSQQFDFSGVIGELIAAIMFAMAKWEKQNIKERQAAGIAVAKERGAYRGRLPGAVKAGVKPDRAIKLRSKGLENAEIAKIMGVSTRTVIRYLQRSE
jgi:DNA invertase Pin-like site-specific DNA recombinase